ncbi:hypothetical protein A7U60_g3078 [Sanghuangporus baumii]|uniref:Uncharacterized protein n=1 Tax=Sanghuangporus baumii TaxID=108892 RepID=A0A9Q5N7B9_SANBA|nr:hypothetical protein A7U60_g3078 [Sanghuangporus baumii]
MHRNRQLPNPPTRIYIRDKNSLKVLLSALAIVVSARAIPILLAQIRRKRHKPWKSVVDESAVRIALFPALLPRVYRYLRYRFGSPGSAELLSSTLLTLLPPSWRIHVVLYAASSALYHSGKPSRWRPYLPPAWILNVVGNAYLLWAFLFQSEGFPHAYERVIFSNSTHYVPPSMKKAELEEILQNATFSETSLDNRNPKRRHNYELCEKLHPQEPSCFKNYLFACLSESLKTSWWVGAFSALSFLLSKRRESNACVAKMVICDDTRDDICIRQCYHCLGNDLFAPAYPTQGVAKENSRILPKEWLRRTRWLINASIASLWILILPDKRRVEISLYVARLAALCAWRTWRLHGGASIPSGDIALFALSWLQLTRLSMKGEKISGLVGLALAKIQ